MRVKWETLIGKRYEGEVIDTNSNVFLVKLDNGFIEAVETDKVVIVAPYKEIDVI